MRRLICAAAVAAAMTTLAGCDGFFVKPGSSSSSTTTGTTGAYAYVSNTANNSGALSIYALASGTLVPAATATFSLGYAPGALVVNPANTFLYASNPALNAIYVYSIGTTGALTQANSGVAVAATINATSMDISPDGKYLFALDGTGSFMAVYSINGSTGVLSQLQTVPYAATLAIPSAVKVAPGGAFVAVSIGTAGTLVFPFNTSTGVVTTSYATIASGSTTLGDYFALFDNNNYLYVSRTNIEAVYSISSAGVPSAATVSTGATSTALRTTAVLSSGGFLYASNPGSATISGFAVGSGGVLTALPTSPFASVYQVSAIGIDRTGKYLVALGYANASSTSGLTMYSISSTGALTATGSPIVTGGTLTVPAVMALTH